MAEDVIKQSEPVTPATAQTETKVPKYSKKKKIIIGSVVGLFALLVLMVIFGTPSADTVFEDMKEEMLQTKSVTLDQTYKLNGKDGDEFDLNSKAIVNLDDNKELKAKGDFSLDLVTGGVPFKVKAEYIAIDDGTYVKFNELSSSKSEVSAAFSKAEDQVKGKWIKVRDGDDLASFSSIAIDTLTGVLPLPYANLSNDQQQAVLDILKDKSTYAISESSKVELDGEPNYKYSISYNKDQYSKLEKKLSEYVSYIKVEEDSGSEIEKMTVWVNINTKRISKIEFEGTSEKGDTQGTIVFSNYNNSDTNIEKPDDYSIESELIKE